MVHRLPEKKLAVALVRLVSRISAVFMFGLGAGETSIVKVHGLVTDLTSRLQEKTFLQGKHTEELFCVREHRKDILAPQPAQLPRLETKVCDIVQHATSHTTFWTLRMFGLIFTCPPTFEKSCQMCMSRMQTSSRETSSDFLFFTIGETENGLV